MVDSPNGLPGCGALSRRDRALAAASAPCSDAEGIFAAAKVHAFWDDLKDMVPELLELNAPREKPPVEILVETEERIRLSA